MSRSGYSEDCENLACWRGQVASASRGKRGQKFFRDLVAALDAIPEKRLVSGSLEKNGEVCALGALGRFRGIGLGELDTYDYDSLGETFNIAHQLAQETMYENDEPGFRGDDAPARRWQHVRNWAAKQIRVTPEELEQ